MSEETAKELLQQYIDGQVQQFKRFTIPLDDDVVLETMGFDTQQTMNTYTWRRLLAAAYP